MIAIFRGGLSPQIITLSIALGFTFGLIPGFSGIHAFIILLFVLMNIHLGLFLLSTALGKSLCLAAAPLLYHFGGFTQDYLQVILVFLSKLPIIGLTDFSTYAVAGALIAGPIIGVITGVLFAKMVLKFRRRWLKLEEGSEAYKKWTSKKWVKVIDRILIGKRTKDVKVAMETKSPMFRKAGLAMVGIPLLIFAAAGLIGSNEKLASIAADKLAKANGAEVNIATIGLSPLSGSLSAENVQVTDPDQPKQNILAFEKFSAGVDVFNLMTGKIVIDDVQIENLTFNTPREKAGKVFKTDQTTEQNEQFDPESSGVNPTDLGKLDKYFKNAQKLKETFKKIQRFLPETRKQTADSKTIPQSIKEYLTAKALEGSVAKFIIKNIALDKVALGGNQFGLSNIKLTNLSDAPIAYGKPIGIELKSVEGQKTLNMEIDFQKDGTGNVTGAFANLDLATFQSQMSTQNAMQIETGTASGKVTGTISRDTIDITIDLQTDNLKVSSSGKGMFGLDAKTTAEVFKYTDNISTRLRIVGPMTAPLIVFDKDALKEQFKQTLVAAGKGKLAEELDTQIEKKLGHKVPDDVKKGIAEGFKSLFGGKKYNKDSDRITG